MKRNNMVHDEQVDLVRVLAILKRTCNKIVTKRIKGCSPYIPSVIQRWEKDGRLVPGEALIALQLTLSELEKYAPGTDDIDKSRYPDVAEHYDYTFIRESIEEMKGLGVSL